MTQEEIEKKAYKTYPKKKTSVGDQWGGYDFDANYELRKGYIKALTELESLPKIHGWVARCKWPCPRELYFYQGEEKPIRCGSQVEDADGDFYWDFLHDIFPLPPTMFPDLKWEDEPIEVELLIKKV